MIAGLLALMLVSADTARGVPLTADTLRDAARVTDSRVAVSLATDSLAPAQVRSAADAAVATAPFMLRVSDGAMPHHTFSPPDTLIRKKKRVLVEYSDWYGRRLTVHRTLSWAMLPLFAASYYTGDRLLTEGRLGVPAWVRIAHPWVATADVAVFGVNTVTGVWNLWDARHDPEGRTKRIIHSVLFMAADAGFAYAGSIGKQARDNGAIRDRHRTIALSSMGVSTLGWLIMLVGK